MKPRFAWDPSCLAHAETRSSPLRPTRHSAGSAGSSSDPCRRCQVSRAREAPVTTSVTGLLSSLFSHSCLTNSSRKLNGP